MIILKITKKPGFTLSLEQPQVKFLDRFRVNTHFNCYETEKSGYLEIFDLDKIYDYHPLGVYYAALKMLIPLHHHLKFSQINPVVLIKLFFN